MRWDRFCFYSFNNRNLDLGVDGVKRELSVVCYSQDNFILKYGVRSVDDFGTLMNE